MPDDRLKLIVREEAVRVPESATTERSTRKVAGRYDDEQAIRPDELEESKSARLIGSASVRRSIGRAIREREKSAMVPASAFRSSAGCS